MYLIAFLVYVVIDVLYYIIAGLKIDNYFYTQAGILGIFYTEPHHVYLFLVFFLLIAYANLALAIIPAVKEKQLSIALKNGLLLGLTAYSTFAMTLIWSIKDFPFLLGLLHIAIGGILSLATSGITTWLVLRKEK